MPMKFAFSLVTTALLVSSTKPESEKKMQVQSIDYSKVTAKTFSMQIFDLPQFVKESEYFLKSMEWVDEEVLLGFGVHMKGKEIATEMTPFGTIGECFNCFEKWLELDQNVRFSISLDAKCTQVLKSMKSYLEFLYFKIAPQHPSYWSTDNVMLKDSKFKMLPMEFLGKPFWFYLESYMRIHHGYDWVWNKHVEDKESHQKYAVNDLNKIIKFKKLKDCYKVAIYGFDYDDSFDTIKYFVNLLAKTDKNMQGKPIEYLRVRDPMEGLELADMSFCIISYMNPAKLCDYPEIIGNLYAISQTVTGSPYKLPRYKLTFVFVDSEKRYKIQKVAVVGENNEKFKFEEFKGLFDSSSEQDKKVDLYYLRWYREREMKPIIKALQENDLRLSKEVTTYFVTKNNDFTRGLVRVFWTNREKFFNVGYVYDADKDQKLSFADYIWRYYPMQFAAYADKFEGETLNEIPKEFFRFVDIAKQKSLKTATKEQICDWLEFHLLNPVVRFKRSLYLDIAYEALKTIMEATEFEVFKTKFNESLAALNPGSQTKESESVDLKSPTLKSEIKMKNQKKPDCKSKRKHIKQNQESGGKRPMIGLISE